MSFKLFLQKAGGRTLLVTFLVVLFALPFVVIAVVLGFLPILVAFAYWSLTFNGLHAVLVGLTGPFCLLVCWHQAASWLRRERVIVDQVGQDRALWVSSAGQGGPGLILSAGAEFAVWWSWDTSHQFLSEGPIANVLQSFGVPEADLKKGFATLGSILWSRLIIMLSDSWVLPVARVGLVFWCVMLLKRVASKWASMSIKWWAIIVATGWALFEMPAELPFSLLMRVLRLIVKFERSTASGIVEWARWRATLIATDILVMVNDVDHTVKRRVSRQLAGDTVTFVAHFREFVVQSVSVVADLKLPEYIRSKGWSLPTKETLEQSNELMASLGWPVNVNLNNAPDPVGFKFKDWILCGSDFKTGITNIKARVDEDLSALFPDADLYKRTETYSTQENELSATARYFKNPRYDMPDLSVDDVWVMIAPIFRESRLTPFNHIIRMWEKKYALGAFMVDPETGKRYRRSKFISDIGGYAPFKALWAKTFYWSTQIVPTASVSIKGEALAPKKWLEDKVRTVVGSPIGQYIMSTIWNYGPNHRFSWETTPIKVGMPLNGGTMSQIWANHSRCQIHVEGDFSEFDSTVSGSVVKLIAAVRKKGFEHHSDQTRIADLIDLNYDMVSDQLLNTHSNGNVYKKGTGLTTGHSSTSMDNSLALVILYLMAWREITGLSAREFKFYNELSCFGDDHFLSILGFHPSGWTPSNIRKTMLRWGVENNVVVKPLHEIEFLAKFCRRPNATMRSELNAAGLPHITMAVWHNKKRLVGKLTAQVKSLNPTYKVERLRSFLGLTAHHKDVYDGIMKYFESNSVMQRVLKSTNKPLPSYNKVLRDWYSKTSEQPRTPWFDDEKDEMEHTGKMFHYGEVSAVDSLLSTLSLLPDVLNPTIFNYGYHRILQARLRPYLAWVYDFIVLQNGLTESGAVKFAMSRTPYRFLEPELFVLGDSGANMTEMIVRHWVFVSLMHLIPRFRPPALVDFVVRRVASTQFAINGKLQSEMATSNPFVLQVAIATAVSLISMPDWFPWMSKARLPDINAIVQMVSHLFMVTIWQNVPALYQEVERGIKYHSWDKGPILVEAATGTGKSTDMPLFLAMRFGHVYSKIVLIVPRTALAVSLVAYLNTISSIGVSGSCEGLTLDRNAKVWVVTSAALWQLVGTMPPNVLLIIDECHLVEDRHVLTRKLAILNKWPTILTSATPSVTNIRECGLHLKLNAANLFSRTDLVTRPVATKVTLKELNSRLVPDLLQVGSKLRPNNRCLFFVNTKQQAETFARMAPRRTAVLVSGVPIDTSFTAQWYVSTTVADVGLTIPQLDVVVTPNIAPYGKDKVVRMSPGLYKQRAGRTGRTNNGIAYLMEYDVDVEDAPTDIPINGSLFMSLFPSGLPPSLVEKHWPSETYEALGFTSGDIDPVVKRKLVVSADFLLHTLQPISRNLREAKMKANPAVGDPFVAEPGTVSAAFSRTHPQNQEQWEDALLESLQFVLNEARVGNSQFVATGRKPPMTSWALPDHMADSFTFSVTGLQQACMKVLQLWNNPLPAINMIADAVPSKMLDEIKAAFEIAEMID